MNTPRLVIAPDPAGMAVTLVIDDKAVGRTVVTREEVEAMRRPLYDAAGRRNFAGVTVAENIRRQLWDRGHAHKVLPLTQLRNTLVRSWDSLRVGMRGDAV